VYSQYIFLPIFSLTSQVESFGLDRLSWQHTVDSQVKKTWLNWRSLFIVMSSEAYSPAMLGRNLDFSRLLTYVRSDNWIYPSGHHGPINQHSPVCESGMTEEGFFTFDHLVSQADNETRDLGTKW